MKKTYYLFNPGRLSRKDNTLKFVPRDEDGNEDKPKYLPIEGIDDLYVLGQLDANSAMFNFLGQKQVAVHFFDYYENYTGSFMPRENLLSGKMIVQQSLHYSRPKKRIELARQFVEGGSFNMLKNLRYYDNRGKELTSHIETIETYRQQIEAAETVEELMGIEGNIRQVYYQSFDNILNELKMEGRSKQPPTNEVNTLISFGNMICYTQCLRTIHHTQLNPTVSFLHTPGDRRFSLALDIAEIFKPILIDRVIFKVLNKKEVQAKHFDTQVNGCVLKQAGKKAFIGAIEQRLTETIQHRTLKRKVSYKHLVKLECYKVAKHILGMETYQPFKAWW